MRTDGRGGRAGRNDDRRNTGASVGQVVRLRCRADDDVHEGDLFPVAERSGHLPGGRDDAGAGEEHQARLGTRPVDVDVQAPVLDRSDTREQLVLEQVRRHVGRQCDEQFGPCQGHGPRGLGKLDVVTDQRGDPQAQQAGHDVVATGGEVVDLPPEEVHLAVDPGQRTVGVDEQGAVGRARRTGRTLTWKTLGTCKTLGPWKTLGEAGDDGRRRRRGGLADPADGLVVGAEGDPVDSGQRVAVQEQLGETGEIGVRILLEESHHGRDVGVDVVRPGRELGDQQA